ncbi:hypothetical protein TKK_0019131 [Trichogramma kaykai]
MEVEIVLEIIHVTNDDDVNALMEVEHQAPVAGAQGDDDVEFLEELPRQPPVRAPQPNPANDDDDAIVMDATSYDRVSCASVRSSVSAEDSSEAGSSAADSGRGKSINVPHAAAAPTSPDPEVNRGVAVDRLPAQADVVAWLRRVEQHQQAPIEMPEEAIEWRVGRLHLNRMLLLRQPNPRFLEGERALGRAEDIPMRDRQLLLHLFDGFRPVFPLVNDCDHALL